MEQQQPPPRLVQRVERLLGRRCVDWRKTNGGYTTAQRWVVTLEDGSSCFVKSGAEPLAQGLRNEFEKAYSRLEAPFMARCLAWEDDGETPVLILEDLSHAHWPPPWDDAKIEGVLATLEKVWRLDLPGLPSVELQRQQLIFDGWQRVAADATPFLSLGLVTPRWLDKSLDVLLKNAEAAVIEGESVLHLDVRSDNICFDGDRAILIDWNHACRGNPVVDLAAWLPSLHSEGGPPPETFLPDEPQMAAAISGFFAGRAGLPPPAPAPRAREVQLSQLSSSLPWAMRALGLPPLDGPRAPTP